MKKAALIAVILLTFLSGCSTVSTTLNLHPEEQCNSRAYLRIPFHEYLRKRFPLYSPVRVGIIPFSTPANLAPRHDDLPGVGNTLVWQLRNELLASGEIPIIEIMDRDAWPEKSREFQTGNYRSIEMARHAGYDLVLVGHVSNARTADSMTVQAKLIEIENRLTIWNGESTVTTNRTERERSIPTRWWLTREPSNLHTNILLDEMAKCLASNLLDEEPVP